MHYLKKSNKGMLVTFKDKGTKAEGLQQLVGDTLDINL